MTLGLAGVRGEKGNGERGTGSENFSALLSTFLAISNEKSYSKISDNPLEISENPRYVDQENPGRKKGRSRCFPGFLEPKICRSREPGEKKGRSRCFPGFLEPQICRSREPGEKKGRSRCFPVFLAVPPLYYSTPLFSVALLLRTKGMAAGKIKLRQELKKEPWNMQK